MNANKEPLARLNAVRVITVLFIAIGYASTMPLGPTHQEILSQLGHDPSWIGIQILFFFSGFLAMRSLANGSTAFTYLRSRFLRNIPVLAIFTLIAVLIIYPLLGVSSEGPTAAVIKLGSYFFATVSCIDPGRALPGLLDEARYMCLIQGAIWTFRWGAIAHICTAIGAKLGLFKTRAIIAGFAAMAVIGYFIVAYIQAKIGVAWLDNPSIGLRLGWPFLVGMTCYAYQDILPKTTGKRMAALSIMIGFATVSHAFLPWTPAIELMLTGFWIYAALLLALSKTPLLGFLNSWPNLALGLYLVNWPTSQLLLLAYPDLGSIELIAVSVPIATVLAFAAHILFTKRFDKLAQRRANAQTPTPQLSVSSPPVFTQ